ncbi:Aldehyde dehydrogenase 5, mitochondrial [Candida viswanathii]|uniref:Aldehyde dehydrogenase 5, mitochondrial n=1 Tax=Candida viswanathii TaxID=5486 RepID=A0A367YP47_9ASCO|nr:Aldehyde dehydrogenase 5, mitochondrial [Candida viswanathii]
MSLPVVTKLTTPKGLSYNQPLGLFINNEFVVPKSKQTFEVFSPSTEEKITDVYEALAEDVDVAAEAAYAAYHNDWALGAPEQRAKILLKLADLVEEHAETLAQIETWDNGKSLQNARGDIGFTAAYFRSCGGWADKNTGDNINTGGTHLTYTQRVPLVCGQIIPWNASTLMASWKLGPVIATGGTTVLKSAEATPLAVLYLAQLLVEAGLPKGVVNIVSGFGTTAGSAIASHPKIDKVAFTGSTNTGKIIMKLAAESNLKKVTLELGGKSPHIVFNDADLDRAVSYLVAAIFSNSGETCAAGSRVLVQSGVYDEVVAKFKKGAEAVKVGDPFDEETFMGSQVNEVQLSRILQYIELGKEQGATVVTGGGRAGDKGYFVKPTIFADVHKDMTIVKEEIFGPVVSVVKFDTIEEAIALANDSEYGLAAGIHTTNISTGVTVANRIKSGTVWVNTYNDLHPMVPFGGFGASGIGREMGAEVMKEYTEVKAVRIKLT